MKILNQSIDQTSANFNLVLDEEDLRDFKLRALNKLKNSVKIPGFRHNKAPVELVEKYLDQSTLQNEVINESFKYYYPKCVNDLKLKVVNDPKITIAKFVPFTELEFKIEVEIIGEIKLKDYKNIKIDLKKEKVSEKELNSAIKEILKRATKFESVNRASQLNDQVTIDFKGTEPKNSEPIKEATSDNYNLVLGSNTFIPGFEEKLIGVKKGQVKKFEITFPKDYHVEEFKSKKVNFEVNVKDVQKPIEAKLDLEFVKSYGPFKTVQEFKEELKKQLQIEKDNQFNRQYEEQLLSKLSEKIDVKLPETMLQNEFTIMKDEDRQKVIARGQTWQEYLKSINDTEESYDTKLKEFAELRIKSGLAIGEIAQKEKIEVSEEEVDKYLDDLRKYYQDPKTIEEIDNPKNRSSFKAQLLSSKTIHKVKDLIKSN